MDQPEFYKFPRTPHMFGSAVVDDDEVISKSQMTAFAETHVVIQEKVDGANVGVHFTEEWNPVIQKRSGIVGTGEKPQFDVWRNWVYERMELLWQIVGTEYCLFGEWLWCKHGVGYSQLPEFFLAFDLLEKKSGKFVSHERAKSIIAGRLNMVPTLYDGPFRQDLDTFIPTLIKKSHFGTEQAEGVYVRFEDAQYVRDRCKLRRATFTSGRENFATKIENNSLKQ